MTRINNKRIRDTRAILHETFPKTFAGDGQEKRPLALSVGRAVALAMPELGPENIEAALADYVNGPTYLRNCIAGAARVNLDGDDEGEVTAIQAGFARGRMKRFVPTKATLEVIPTIATLEAAQ
jgi:ProP effector